MDELAEVTVARPVLEVMAENLLHQSRAFFWVINSLCVDQLAQFIFDTGPL